MSMGYSEDLRERVIEFIETGGKVKDAIQIFKVSAMSISRWRRNKAQYGHVKNKKQTVWFRKVNREQLKTYIENNPDQLLSEIGEYFGVSASTIHRNLTALNIVYKKNPSICRKG